MSMDGLTPDPLRKQHASAIPRAETFEPQGISKRSALDYLNTDEGSFYLQRLAEADPKATPWDLDTRALQQLMSGRELPRMVTLDTSEPLVKIVPTNTSPSGYSPYWTGEDNFSGRMDACQNRSRQGIALTGHAHDIERIKYGAEHD